ncbi:MAG TPA: tetratricopeptide repeat protein, partial [bacterium]|nr:tetratricopeptide repeat protein [bacterium]
MKCLGFALILIFLTTGIAFAAPKTAVEYFAMGAQLYSVKDYQGAAYSYEAGLELDPNNAGAYQGLGDCYYFLGRQTDAMTAYQKSLALNPQNLKLAEYVKTFKPQDAGGTETETTMFSQMQATPVIDYGTTNSEPSTVKL